MGCRQVRFEESAIEDFEVRLFPSELSALCITDHNPVQAATPFNRVEIYQ